jgi:hypothetical protein
MIFTTFCKAFIGVQLPGDSIQHFDLGFRIADCGLENKQHRESIQ